MRQGLFVMGLALLVSVAPSPLGAQVQASASFAGEGLRNFYLAIGNFYQAAPGEVALLRENNVPYDEMPVVLFIVREAHVSPASLIDLRRRGVSWFDISIRYGIQPETYLVPGGPPYGKAWGYYRKQGRVVFLRDTDIVDSVNVRFLSSYYGIPIEEIRELRSHGAGYYVIAENRPLHKEKYGAGEDGGRPKDRRKHDR